MLEASGTVERINIVTDAGRRFSFTLEDAVKLVEQVVPLLVERGWEFKPCARCGTVTDIHTDEFCLLTAFDDVELTDEQRAVWRERFFAYMEADVKPSDECFQWSGAEWDAWIERAVSQ